MLEGTITIRVSRDAVFAALAKSINEQISGSYNQTHTCVVTELVEDTTDEMSYKITFDRTPKPKETK